MLSNVASENTPSALPIVASRVLNTVRSSSTSHTLSLVSIQRPKQDDFVFIISLSLFLKQNPFNISFYIFQTRLQVEERNIDTLYSQIDSLVQKAGT